MLTIGVKSNIAQLTAGIPARFQKQVAFAAQQAVNATAQIIQDAERDELHAKLKKHVPFTLQSVALKKARSKKNPTAKVYIKDIGAAYIGPYITGGKNHLTGKALNEPINIGLNSYGNIPRGKIKSLLSKPNVFAGPVTLKKQGLTVSGIWERIPIAGSAKPATGKRRVRAKASNRASVERTKLKLLVRFEDAHDTPAKIDWYQVAQRTVRQHFNAEFSKAFRRAVATAK